MSPNPYHEVVSSTIFSRNLQKTRRAPTRRNYSNSSLVDFSPSNTAQHLKTFNQFGHDNFPFNGDLSEGKAPPIVKTKFFSSAESDLLLDPIEANRVSVDFETLSLPGVAPVGIVGSSPGKLGLDSNTTFMSDEAQLKIQSDFMVGDKRMPGPRGIIGGDAIKALHNDMMDEVLSIGALDDKVVSISTKRVRLN